MVAGAPVTSELTKQLLERLPDVQLGQAYGKRNAIASEFYSRNRSTFQGMTETCAAVSIVRDSFLTLPLSRKFAYL